MTVVDITAIREREDALRRLTDTADEMDLMDYLVAFTAGNTGGPAFPGHFPQGVDLHIPSAGLQSMLHRWARDVHDAAEVLDGDAP